MESRKTVLMNLCAGQQWKHRHIEQICGHSKGRRGWGELRSNIETYITIYKIDTSVNLLYDTGGSNPVL